MSRRHAAEKREVLPDAKYKNVVVTKFVNCLMYDGKKSVAENVVYGALDTVTQKTKRDAIECLMEVLKNLTPSVEVKSRRIGGATYQVPVEVRPVRGMRKALAWLIEAARGRSEKTMTERLAGEMLDALNNRGTAVKKREDTHKMAEANKAFAHYRF